MTVEQLERGAKIARLNTAERVDFGPLSHYHPLMDDGTTAVRTGIQTCQPGYTAAMHHHPYEELLFILEGQAEVWLQGEEGNRRRLIAGDMISLPPNIPHSFAVVGDQPMKLLGIHHSKERVVRYLEGETDGAGYPVLPDLDENMKAKASS